MFCFTSMFCFTDVLLQVLFVVAIVSVFVAKYTSKFRGFLKYGKTLDTIKQRHESWIINEALNFQIPKVWFAHFYLLSLILSAVTFTLVQLTMSEYQFWVIDLLKLSQYGQIPIEISRLVSFLILGHSLKRLSETLLMMNYNSSKSKMNIAHYLVGIFFYSGINFQLILNTNFNDLSSIDYSGQDIYIYTIAPVLLFLLASASQFLHHLHLSKLIKYTTPSFGMFRFLCCAHYFDEILIYLSIFALLKNFTTFLALTWVIINLSVSSIETKSYYKKNSDGKTPKWSIIPFIL